MVAVASKAFCPNFLPPLPLLHANYNDAPWRRLQCSQHVGGESGVAGLAGLTATYLMNLLRLNRSRCPLGGAGAGAGAGEGAQAEVAAGVAACTSVGI